MLGLKPHQFCQTSSSVKQDKTKLKMGVRASVVAAFDAHEEEEECYKLRPANKTDHLFCPAYYSIRDRFTDIFWGPAPTMSSFFALHDPRVIAKFLHEYFAHRSMLLEEVLGVPQH